MDDHVFIITFPAANEEICTQGGKCLFLDPDICSVCCISAKRYNKGCGWSLVLVTSYRYLLTLCQNLAIGAHVHRQCFNVGICVLYFGQTDLDSSALCSFEGYKIWHIRFM